MHAYSNRRELSDDLARAAGRLRSENRKASELFPSRVSVQSVATPRMWRIDERLTAEDARQLVVLYASGSTIRELAIRYSIGTTSVKKLLREGGAISKHRRPVELP